MTEPQDLQQLSVLITRPREQGTSLAAAIRKYGGNPVLFPLMRISPLNEADSQAILTEQMQRLNQFDLAIFISTNAVRYGMEWVNRYWSEFPGKTKVFAIGPTTAEALSEWGIDVYLSSAGMLSEDLLALPELQHVKGFKIALFRGRGGRQLIAETLHQRGAEVEYIETYERKPEGLTTADLESVVENEKINVISVTSGQILESLCQLVDIGKETVHQVPLLVPSERIRKTALAAGFKQVINCGGANDEAILAGLKAISGDQSDSQIV